MALRAVCSIPKIEFYFAKINKLQLLANLKVGRYYVIVATSISKISHRLS